MWNWIKQVTTDQFTGLETSQERIPAMNGVILIHEVVVCLTTLTKRLRWSRGSVLAFGTQVRGFKPDRRRRILTGRKTLSVQSRLSHVVDLRHVKDPWMLRGSRAFSGKIHRPFLAHVVPPSAARLSWRRLLAKVGTFENKKVHKHLRLWPLGLHRRRLAVRAGTFKGSTISQYGCSTFGALATEAQ